MNGQMPGNTGMMNSQWAAGNTGMMNNQWAAGNTGAPYGMPPRGMNTPPKKYRITGKVVAFTIILMILILLLAGVGVLTLWKAAPEKADAKDIYAEGRFDLYEAQAAFLNMEVHSRSLPIRYYAPGLLFDLQDYVTLMNRYESEMTKNLERFADKLDSYDSKELRGKYDSLSKTIEDWTGVADGCVALMESSEGADVNTVSEILMVEGKELSNQANDLFRDMTELLDGEADQVRPDSGDAIFGDLEIETVRMIVMAVMLGLAVFTVILLIVYAIVLVSGAKRVK